MKKKNIQTQEKATRSKKAPVVDHPVKEHVTRHVEAEMQKKPVGGRFGKKWFPYNK